MVLVMDGSEKSATPKRCPNGDLKESTELLHEISARLKRRSFEDVRNSSSHSLLSTADHADQSLGNALDTPNAKNKAVSDILCDGISSEIGTKHLKQLLLLHLDLIEEQQQQMVDKDKTISKLKNEKEQLEAKVCRMERRLLIGAKTVGKASNTETTKQTDKEKIGKRLSLQCANDVPRKTKRSSNIGAVLVSSKQFKDTPVNGFMQTSSTYLHEKNLSTPAPTVVVSANDNADVLTPGWKLVSDDKEVDICLERDNPTEDKEEEEDDEEEEAITEDAFLRRHQKLEADERRRKRWDMQRIRQEHMQEALRQRQLSKEKAKKDSRGKFVCEVEETVESLAPPLNRVLQIEVSNDVPVNAFGCRIASLNSSEFNLPWFDVDKRELQMRKQSERSSGSSRHRRKSSHY